MVHFLFMWGPYSCMGAYERDMVLVIKMGAYIPGCLFTMGAYYPILRYLAVRLYQFHIFWRSLDNFISNVFFYNIYLEF